MKRISFNSVYYFSSIKIGDAEYTMPRSCAQTHFYTMFTRLIDRGNGAAAQAIGHLEEGRKFEAARSLISTDAIKGEFAEWLLPMFIEDAELSHRVALQLCTERLGYEARDAIRNYSWKVEAILELQNEFQQHVQALAANVEEDHAQALEIDAARNAGFTLLFGSEAVSRSVYDEYRKLVKDDALPDLRNARFLLTTGKSVPVTVHDENGQQSHVIDKKLWDRAVAKIIAKEAKKR